MEVLTDNPAFTRSILGTSDPEKVGRRLNSFCEERLGSGVGAVIFCYLSVGASFGLRLTDGRRVFLKAHPPERPAEYLEAVHRVQGHLHKRGFPCPRPLAGPAPFTTGFATVDEFVAGGEVPDAHDPITRRKMAGLLHDSMELARAVPDVRGLERGWPWPAKDRLWPRPHNALFDFEATADGAGWIDAFAARAKSVVDGFEGRTVVGHTDWTVDQMRAEGGEIFAVYDWDSLRPEKEVVVVGIAASNFTSTWSREVPNPPDPGETQAFVEDYEEKRGEPFSEKEREAIFAAAIYAIAYVARCEHAVDAGGRDYRGSFREALPRHGNVYFR